MDRQILLRKIMGVSDKVHRLQQDITALQYIDVASFPDNYHDISYKAAIQSEYIVQKLRRLIFETTNTSKVEYLTQAAISLDISIKEVDGTVEIVLPCLIPKRKSKPTEFLSEPFYAAMSQFISSIQLPFERFEDCVICITHVYDKSLFNKRRIRDHNNLEIKGIIDVINLFMLIDDSGNRCDIYNSSEVADSDTTRISVMKKDMFPEWIYNHISTRKTISQNSEFS